ncbi:alanine racemase [Isachenkonia alkalipeptolytica]|uniref:D-TA family PLP-dependent enzyme n=1 Tax=Isachenkonia alkalipeptolytica TaxID=2565777 RepID=A0AA44BF56_9CLOT|nr:alanine racemase [Isachenkonia alkalipeptolytica]NBG88256.1 D-TA family PLP-dependent enzyme [Isachenkonia alkalipeptolytica]
MNYLELDTPALLIDREIMEKNCKDMQDYADREDVALRPHTKTHKMSKLALFQENMGAKGITVAKVGEGEVMASKGLKDIFIANEIVGEIKLRRVRELAKDIDISFGLDSILQAKMVEVAFEGAEKKARVLIEIEVGEERSGVVTEERFTELLDFLKQCSNIELLGVFSHDGHSYGAKDQEECRIINLEAQRRTLQFAELARKKGFLISRISIGSTPSMIFNFPILKGITEIRPGTYIFMDASQANAYGNFTRNAATILSTVISIPTEQRVIIDVGAKGLTTQRRTKGFTATKGLGRIKDWSGVALENVFDEHGILNHQKFHDAVQVGDKIEIIPNHICPVVNLHETAYLISDGKVIEKIPVDCRGKLK